MHIELNKGMPAFAYQEDDLGLYHRIIFLWNYPYQTDGHSYLFHVSRKCAFVFYDRPRKTLTTTAQLQGLTEIVAVWKWNIWAT